jgi:hypothetical protein
MDYLNVPLRAAWNPGSVSSLQQILGSLVDSGDVSGPVASQLAASVQQARTAVDDGDSARAGQAIQRFVDFLGQQKKPDHVTDAARAVLDHHAGNILRAFKG